LKRYLKKLKPKESEIYDAIIIGAGPAGSTAASVIAEYGNTLIIDKKKTIGIPNHCGEGISQYVLDFLNLSKDKEWIVKEVKGGRLIFPNNTTIYFPQKGYCIDRTRFDQELAEKAIKKGARLLTEEEVMGAELREDTWNIYTRKGKKFKGRYLIAADGASSIIRRIFKLPQKCINAIQYKFPPLNKFAEDWLLFYHDEKFYPAYAWVFHRGIETSVGVGGFGNVKKLLDEFCKFLGISKKPKSIHGGKIPFTKKPVKITLPRLVFAGDAGGFLFPLTKGGILGALFSGRKAGEVVKEAIKEKNPEIIYSYPEKVKTFPSRDRLTLFLPHTFLSLTNEMINAIGKVLDKEKYTKIPFFSVARYLFKKPSLKIAYGFIIGFLVQRIYHYKKHFAW